MSLFEADYLNRTSFFSIPQKNVCPLYVKQNIRNMGSGGCAETRTIIPIKTYSSHASFRLRDNARIASITSKVRWQKLIDKILHALQACA